MPAPKEPKITVDERKQTLTIVLPLVNAKRPEDLPQSKTGKSYTVATTHGIIKPPNCTVHGRQIRVGVNAFIPKTNDS